MVKIRHTGSSKRARVISGAGSPDTAKQLINPSRLTHDANFSRILPREMDRLVREGLFEPDGNGSYRITEKGRAKLVELEGDQNAPGKRR